MDLTGGSNNEERQTRPGGNVIEAAADPTYEVRVTLVGGPHALRSIVSSPLINSLPLSPRSSRYFVTVRTGGLSFFTEHPFPADRDKARPGEEKVFLSHLKLLSLEMSTNQLSPLTVELLFPQNKSKILLTTLNTVYTQRAETVDSLLKARLKIQARDVDFISNLRRGCEDLYLKIFSQCAKCCPSFTNLYAKYSIVLKKVKHRRRKENGEILNEINRQDNIIKDTMTDARRDSNDLKLDIDESYGCFCNEALSP
ncbi:hypothetical protein TrST_g551 [Triparma strigata]|uniref:Uncharacterized protein n=1 Tax=Triparma strigata TaxID=1606541 RepID=A0A9W7EW34_9STRA|nr:hypothetical protein TrST_g551 [Triparma strigata]